MNEIPKFSIFELKKFELPNAEEYVYAIYNIQFADTGIIEAQETNNFFIEASQMIFNAIQLFQEGYFDSAFYSLRQSIELSIGTLFLYANPDKIKAWNKLEDGFETGRMQSYLKENEPNFKEIREKLADYFDNLFSVRRKIDKYVHKQGYRSFHLLLQRSYDNNLKKIRKIITKDFEECLKSCIGAVAIYRLIIDPMPLVLADEDLYMRSGDFVTSPYSANFIKEYIGNDIVKKLKSTPLYQNIESWLQSQERQSDATFNLIHYQGFCRSNYEDVVKQLHLCSFHDRIAVGTFMCSTKISNIFLEGFFWYWSDVKSKRKRGITMGESYYSAFFENTICNYNLPYENVFLSRFYMLEKFHYIEHNEKLLKEEIDAIQKLFNELESFYKETESGSAN